ncbi:hypothetical protein EX30DRAFT_53363, partial [Ascodesmis nigricans]
LTINPSTSFLRSANELPPPPLLPAPFKLFSQFFIAMSSSPDDSEPEYFEHEKRRCQILTNTSYLECNRDMEHISRAMNVWDVVNEAEGKPVLPNKDHPTYGAVVTELKEFEQRERQASAALFYSCDRFNRYKLALVHYLVEMWKVLNKDCNCAIRSIGWTLIFNKISTLKPVPGRPISEFIDGVVSYQMLLNMTEDKLNDTCLIMIIRRNLPTDLPTYI